MTEFLSRPLAALEGLYRFKGGLRGVGDVDLASPVVLVHDVSRQAEASAGFAAAWPVTVTSPLNATTYGSESLADFFAEATTASQMNSHRLVPALVNVWLRGVSGVLSAAAANLNVAYAGITLGNAEGSGVVQMVETDLRDTGADLVTGGATHLASYQSGTGTDFLRLPKQQYPILLPDFPNTAVLTSVTATAGGSATVTIYFHVWVGPKGSFPPNA